MGFEPQRSSVGRAQGALQKNPYEGRWNWWYSSIADVMIRSPSFTKEEIALELRKHPHTISLIVNTDMFQDYLAQRKDAWRREHDFALVAGLTKVAELSIESAASFLEKKKDQVPLPVAVEAMNSALDRLGYGPKPTAQVAIQVNQDARAQTVIVQGVSASVLEEARQALRIAESKRAEEYDSTRPISRKALVEPARPARVLDEGQQETLDLFAVDMGEETPAS